MTEHRLKNREYEASRPVRLEYGAVPLNGWTAVDPENPEVGYALASLDRIQLKTEQAMQAAIENGWVTVDEYDADGAPAGLPAALKDLIAMSLFDSQMQRVDRNTNLGAVFLEKDPRLAHAKEGVATPSELLSLLHDNPRLGSLELAKLSHPLDNDTSAMDDAIYLMLLEQWGDFSPEAPTYKTKTMAASIPAATVLRKQRLATYETANGPIAIIRRQAFLVRGDAQADDLSDASYLDRKVRNESRHEDDIFPMVEEALPHLGGLKWVSPLATSYYAKNLSTAVKYRSER